MTTHSPCAEAVEKVYPFIDGELTWIAKAKIRWHLRACSKCEAAYEFERRFKAKVHDDLQEECPDEVLNRLKGFLDEHR